MGQALGLNRELEVGKQSNESVGYIGSKLGVERLRLTGLHESG